MTERSGSGRKKQIREKVFMNQKRNSVLQWQEKDTSVVSIVQRLQFAGAGATMHCKEECPMGYLVDS